MSVNIAFVGAGGIAGMHLASLSALPNVSIVGITDPDHDACLARQTEFEIPTVAADLDELLELNPDGILVCTPTFTHSEIVCRASEGVRYIFCEKPLARTLNEADEMMNVCEKNGAEIMLGFVRRFCPAWNCFKSLLEQGVIGRPVVWRFAYASGGPPSPWYLDRDKGAGPFLDGMVHNYDFCRYAFGELKEVRSTLTTLKHDSNALDTGSAHMTFDSGDQHVILGSWGLPTGAHTPGIHDALGPDGAILFTDSQAPPDDIDSEQYGYFASYTSGNERAIHTYRKEDMFLKEMTYFADVIAQKGKPSPNGMDGFRALEIALKVLGEA